MRQLSWMSHGWGVWCLSWTILHTLWTRATPSPTTPSLRWKGTEWASRNNYIYTLFKVQYFYCSVSKGNKTGSWKARYSPQRRPISRWHHTARTSAPFLSFALFPVPLPKPMHVCLFTQVRHCHDIHAPSWVTQLLTSPSHRSLSHQTRLILHSFLSGHFP